MRTTNIRIATKRDAATLSELASRLFEQTFGPANTPEDMRAYLDDTFRPELQEAELSDPDRVVFLVEEADAPIGYASLRREGSDSAEIERIYVDRSLHGRNVGAQLMDACIEQARVWGCASIWLAVWERNPRAIAFYEKSGFVKTGVKDFRLGSDVQHDHVMSRQLH